MPPIRFRIRTLMIVIAAVAVLMAMGPILVNLDPIFILGSLIAVLLLAIFVAWLAASLALWIAVAVFGIAYLFRRVRTTLGILRILLDMRAGRLPASTNGRGKANEHM